MIKPSARHKARRFAVQALYQWHFTKRTAAQIRDDFLAENNMAKVDMVYFDALTKGVIEQVDALDTKLSHDLTRPINKLDPVTLSVLRLAIFELSERVDVPYAIIIDEAIKIIKLFGAQDSYSFVNSVLDKAAQRWRPLEYTHRI